MSLTMHNLLAPTGDVDAEQPGKIAGSIFMPVQVQFVLGGRIPDRGAPP